MNRRQFLIAASLATLGARAQAAHAESTDQLMISEMRKRIYPGSALTPERSLPRAATYDRSVVSYQSEGLKIFAYLTVPRGNKPAAGWPVVIFNHGYIPPAQYRTTERYIAYQDAFARNGYIVFRSDYRGHGSSEGDASGGYGSPDYTVDVLNAVGAMRRFADADGSRIGMWGHSMGGHITLRSMVVDRGIKAGVIWAGVVASYADLLNNWRRRNPNPTPAPTQARRWRQTLVEKFGEPAANPTFWNAISPISYVSDLGGPLQIHHGDKDSSVPIAFSESLTTALKTAGEPHEYFAYAGDDHNLSRNLSLALRRSVAFFKAHV
jgi:uncharacterized protein